MRNGDAECVRWPAIAAATLLALVAASVALLIVAIVRYPGGSYADPHQHGFDFVHNFVCDLLASTAQDGAPNPGAPCALAGMLAAFAALPPFWLLQPRLFPERRRLGGAVRALGGMSSGILPFVPLAPSRWCGGAAHALAIYAGGAPALVAALLCTYSLVAGASRWPHGALAASVVAVAAADGAMYGLHLASGESVPHWPLPVVQKLGAVLLFAWLVATALSRRAR